MRALKIISLIFILLLAGCVSQPRPTKLGLSDFGRDEAVYAAYLQSYAAGYEMALRGVTEDRCYFVAKKFSASDRAIAIGWIHGQQAGFSRLSNQSLKTLRNE